MHIKVFKIEMNTSWQFCFSTMYIGESEGLFETRNCGQPLGLRCGRNLRDSGDHADDISQITGVPKKGNRVTQWPLQMLSVTLLVLAM